MEHPLHDLPHEAVAIRNITKFDGSLDVVYQQDLQGWNGNHPIFAELIDELSANLIIEVGTYKGQSAEHMARLLEQRGHGHIICVDTFLGGHEAWTWETIRNGMPFREGRPDLYRQFVSNIKHAGLLHRVTPLPLDSRNAALVLKDLHVVADIIYIDASHDTDSVAEDIEAYLRLLQTHGVMVGDDWTWPSVQAGVRRALHAHQYLRLDTRNEKWMLRRSR